MNINSAALPATSHIPRRLFLKSLLTASAATVLGTVPAIGNTGGVRLGIDVLEGGGFMQLRGRRVGLLTHPAGVNRFGISTIDVLRRSPAVQLVALFGPEHGIYGNEKANVPVDDRIDPRTGLPVYSLYGRYRRPTPAMLDKIDVMVVDLQDIGARSYTYVSCMRYVMEEAFKAGKEVIILDRPNPLGGLKIDGPPLESAWRSYVGAFPVPYLHGLTIGELARMAQLEPGVMEVDDRTRKAGRLRIIPMTGWSRSTMWPQTGLNWVPTSPAIPDLSAVMGYPMTGLGCQLGNFSHGYGTRLPFRLVQFTGKTPEFISAALQSRGIRGLEFPIVPFEVKGRPHRATYVKVSSWDALRPAELSLHMMALAAQWQTPNPFTAAAGSQRDLFTKHVGDSRVIAALDQIGPSTPQAAVHNFVARFVADWEAYGHRYLRQRQPWLLYR